MDAPREQEKMPGGPSAPAPAWPASDLLEVVRAMGGGTLYERMGIEITAAAPGRVAGTMPVAGNTQPYGLLHGGASVVLAETLGSLAAMLHAGPARIAVGLDINATHHRAVSQGHVIGVASAIAEGSTIASYQVSIEDQDGRRVCTCRITCLLRDRPAARR